MTDTVASASATAEEVPVHTHTPVAGQPQPLSPQSNLPTFVAPGSSGNMGQVPAVTTPLQGREGFRDGAEFLGSRDRASRSTIAAHDRISLLRSMVTAQEALMPASAPLEASKFPTTNPPATHDVAILQVSQLLHLVRELHAAIKNPIIGVD